MKKKLMKMNIKKMKYGIKKAEDRVHYYLDVFNYIK